MGRKKTKYKVGDKVNCSFLGEQIKGVVERIIDSKVSFSKSKKTYWVFDGKYRYPISIEKIKGLVNE